MEMADVILVPPEAPMTSLASPFASTNIVGLMDDNGRFPGFSSLFGDPGKPK